MCIANGWSGTCIAIKSSDDGYVVQPTDVDPLLAAAVSRINNEAVMAMSSEAIISIIDAIPAHQKSLIIEATGSRIPIVPSLEDIHSELCHYSRACMVVKERVVVVWSNDPKTIINVTHHVERELLELVSTWMFNWLN
jgi:hypothetical protein